LCQFALAAPSQWKTALGRQPRPQSEPNSPIGRKETHRGGVTTLLIFCVRGCRALADLLFRFLEHPAVDGGFQRISLRSHQAGSPEERGSAGRSKKVAEEGFAGAGKDDCGSACIGMPGEIYCEREIHEAVMADVHDEIGDWRNLEYHSGNRAASRCLFVWDSRRRAEKIRQGLFYLTAAVSIRNE